MGWIGTALDSSHKLIAWRLRAEVRCGRDVLRDKSHHARAAQRDRSHGMRELHNAMKLSFQKPVASWTLADRERALISSAWTAMVVEGKPHACASST
jgi:hypothetical protein